MKLLKNITGTIALLAVGGLAVWGLMALLIGGATSGPFG